MGIIDRDLGGGGGGAGEGGLFDGDKFVRFRELKAFLSSDKGLCRGGEL